jgi:hypothetical protein
MLASTITNMVVKTNACKQITLNQNFLCLFLYPHNQRGIEILFRHRTPLPKQQVMDWIVKHTKDLDVEITETGRFDFCKPKIWLYTKDVLISVYTDRFSVLSWNNKTRRKDEQLPILRINAIEKKAVQTVWSRLKIGIVDDWPESINHTDPSYCLTLNLSRIRQWRASWTSENVEKKRQNAIWNQTPTSMCNTSWANLTNFGNQNFKCDARRLL